MKWKTRAKIWLWSGKAAWHFVTVANDLAARIKRLSEGMRSPTGSIRVIVSINGQTWKTSLFPTKKRTYLLPIKAAVRKKAKVGAGDTVTLTIELES